MKRGDSIAIAAIAAFTVLQTQTVTAFVPVLQRQHPEPIRCAFLSANAATTTTTTITNIPEWTPRSRYWKDNDIKGMSRNELAEQMGLDIQDPNSKYGAPASTETLEQQQPTVKKLHRNKLDKVIAVEITSALSETQASRIQTLAASIRGNHETKMNHLFEHRSFGSDKGGNDCTYLAPLLQLLMPEIAQTVVSIVRLAWEEAGWNQREDEGTTTKNDPQVVLLPPFLKHHPNPMDLGIRTSEHFSYDEWRSGLEPHKDDGSIYTCNVALKEPNIDFTGGEFFLQTSFLEQIEVKPERLSAIVFLSDTTHGVRPITSGSRVSFVTEFWNHDDAPLGMNRPTPNEWEDFVQKQK